MVVYISEVCMDSMLLYQESTVGISLITLTLWFRGSSKARYFPDTHILNARIGQKPSFIWKGIVTAMGALSKGFRWVLGNRRTFSLQKINGYGVRRTFVLTTVIFMQEDRWRSLIILFLNLKDGILLWILIFFCLKMPMIYFQSPPLNVIWMIG